MTLIEKIRSAARELASERSVDDISVIEVARRAGVSRQTVYHHVGGTEKLREMIKRDLAYPSESDRDTRSRLVAAAQRVFAAYGYEHATLDQVAADAGLSKGAVYWHFASKGDLFLALMEQRFRQQQAAALQSIRSMPAVANQTEALARLVSDQLSACQADPTWPALWLEFVCQRREPELRSRLTDFHRSARLVQAEFVKRLQEQGSLPANVDPATIVELFDAFSTGITMAWLIDPENINPMHLGAALIRLLWNGLGPKNL